jgi:hypothetical protein
MLYRSFPDFTHDVWLCQPAQTLQEAVWICNYWREHGTNPLEKGISDDPHASVIWESEDAYHLSNAEHLGRIVSIIQTERVTYYQAMLPYVIS